MSFEEQLLLQQQIYLYQPYLLADLLNKMDSPTLFTQAESALNPHIDNISFGPIEITFQLGVKKDSRMNIICFCLLQYLFESKCNKASEVY
jgi:hypothetical protein